jgi:tRNA-2-methylthio-N6-dimethylallyladenosine synthase
MTRARSFFIETYGCEMNKSDSLDLRLLLEERGCVRAGSAEEADIVVLNTCSVRENAEERIVGRLGHYRSLKTRRRNGPVIVFAGCMAQEQQEKILESFPEIGVVAGTYEEMRIPEAVDLYERTGEPVVITGREEFAFPRFGGKRAVAASVFVPIVMGCSNFCSYCVVPHVRGPEISRRSAEILDEVRALADGGVVEITLLGQNVNAYGRDSGDISFLALLERVSEIEGIRWIRFLTSHPRDFDEEVIRGIGALDKVARHVHLPLQSGSDRILSLMNRHYDMRRYRRVFEDIARYMPGSAVTSDLIVGFPTETEGDFRLTLDAVEEFRFDESFTYRYSPRPFTPSRLMEQVPPEVAGRRLEELIDLQRAVTRERSRKEIGEVVTALVEGESRKDPEELLCRTSKGKPLVVRTGSRPGTFIRVRITGLSGATLRGVEAVP